MSAYSSAAAPITEATLALFAKPASHAWEREAAQAFAANRAAIVARGDVLFELGFPCTGCGRFSFENSTLCFWCRR